MKQSSASLGPRTWAIVSLAGGALLATPFFRPPAADDPASNLEKAIHSTASPFGATFSQVAEGTVGNIPTFQSASAVQDARIVAGKLPTTMPAPATKLPDWVQTPSQLDRLISKPEPAPSHDEAMARADAVAKSKPREFRAWRSPSPGQLGPQSAASIEWNAPAAQPGYHPSTMAQAPAASPWGVDRILAVSPPPAANNVFATKLWPDDAMLPEIERIGLEKLGGSRAATTASNAGAEPQTLNSSGRNTAVSATLRRDSASTPGSQPTSSREPIKALPESVPLPPASHTASPPSAKGERRFVYQPGMQPQGMAPNGR